MINRLFCWMGRCLQCAVYDTPEGIGGRCINCGKVHGWVTRAELRAYADREWEEHQRRLAATPPGGHGSA